MCTAVCCTVFQDLVYVCVALLRLQTVHRPPLRVYCSVLQCVAVSGVCVCDSFEGANGA